jgi:uncharacterized membrane protein YhaH (DUF805 family)
MDYAWFLFSFEGRINRVKFLWAGLIILSWMIILGMLMLAVHHVFGGPKSFYFGARDILRLVDPESYRSLSSADLVPLFVKTIAMPLFVWVGLATSIKRLHDRNKSGWWMVPFFVVPGLHDQFADRLGNSYAADLFGIVAGVLALWGSVEMLFPKGTRGPNRFGPDPLAPVSPSPHAASRWDQHRELEFVPHRAGLSAGA